MYRLNISGGEYEDKFEHIYYSNNIEKLKDKGVEELMFDDEVCGFYIHEIKLEGDEVKGDPYFNPLYCVDSDDIKDEINFRKLSLILKYNDTSMFKFKGEDNGGVYIVEIERINENKITIVKINYEKDEVLDFNDYSMTNCHGSLVTQVIYEYCDREEEEWWRIIFAGIIQ